LICNTYHLHLKPGEEIIKKAGGLHKFMNWPLSLMTDSGGFQVFSLGFGRDYGMGKVLKEKSEAEVVSGQQPAFLKITEDGVWFRSIIDGRKLFMGPKESIKIQEDLGADIIFAFDECPPPIADYEYIKKSMEKTHRWAKECLKVKSNKKQALYGIVQGGKFKDLRIESAKFIGSLPFDGFGIGGEFGGDKKIMEKMLKWVNKELPENKPRHLLGIGHPEDLLPIIRAGVDTFDCTAPTHYARRGVAFTSAGRLDLRRGVFLKDQKPIDKKCDCAVCKSHSRSYIHHLLKAKEITPLRLLSFHNLYFFNSLIEKIREDIKNGKI
jgi:queuine tRNA-ribosyltransferase/7-cyano-7-deazaguanine tRNA-ribosyltransferase